MRYDKTKLDELPDIVTTKIVMNLWGCSQPTACKVFNDYKKHCISTKPFAATQKNFIKMLSKELPTDADIRREEKRKERISKKCSTLSESYF